MTVVRPVDADAGVIRSEPVRAPFDSCPSCDGRTFDTEATADRPVFRCVRCGAGWLYELGYVWRTRSVSLSPLDNAARSRTETSIITK